MLYCSDIMKSGILVVNSKTLERYRVTYDTLYDMFKCGEYVQCLDTYCMFLGHKISLCNIPEGLEYSGFVRDLGTLSDYVLGKNKTELASQGVNFKPNAILELLTGSKIPISLNCGAYSDYSMVADDVIIVKRDEYVDDISIWYDGASMKLSHLDIHAIYRIGDEIHVSMLSGLGMTTETKVLVLSNIIGEQGEECTRQLFQRKYLLSWGYKLCFIY